MMPLSPAANLVLAEATLLLRVLEGALDEVALSLHMREPHHRRFGSGVREAVLDRSGFRVTIRCH